MLCTASYPTYGVRLFQRQNQIEKTTMKMPMAATAAEMPMAAMTPADNPSEPEAEERLKLVVVVAVVVVVLVVVVVIVVGVGVGVGKGNAVPLEQVLKRKQVPPQLLRTWMHISAVA